MKKLLIIILIIIIIIIISLTVYNTVMVLRKKIVLTGENSELTITGDKITMKSFDGNNFIDMNTFFGVKSTSGFDKITNKGIYSSKKWVHSIPLEYSMNKYYTIGPIVVTGVNNYNLDANNYLGGDNCNTFLHPDNESIITLFQDTFIGPIAGGFFDSRRDGNLDNLTMPRNTVAILKKGKFGDDNLWYNTFYTKNEEYQEYSDTKTSFFTYPTENKNWLWPNVGTSLNNGSNEMIIFAGVVDYSKNGVWTDSVMLYIKNVDIDKKHDMYDFPSVYSWDKNKQRISLPKKWHKNCLIPKDSSINEIEILWGYQCYQTNDTNGNIVLLGYKTVSSFDTGIYLAKGKPEDFLKKINNIELWGVTMDMYNNNQNPKWIKGLLTNIPGYLYKLNSISNKLSIPRYMPLAYPLTSGIFFDNLNKRFAYLFLQDDYSIAPYCNIICLACTNKNGLITDNYYIQNEPVYILPDWTRNSEYRYYGLQVHPAFKNIKNGITASYIVQPENILVGKEFVSAGWRLYNPQFFDIYFYKT